MPKGVGYKGSHGGNNGPVKVSHFENGPAVMDKKSMGERPTKSTKDTKRGGIS